MCRDLGQLLAGKVRAGVSGGNGAGRDGGLIGLDGCTEAERDMLDAADASYDEAREVAAAKRQARRDEQGLKSGGAINDNEEDDG